jgi:hypothetical protein
LVISLSDDDCELVENFAMNQNNLLEVDWSKIPAPADDGTARNLPGQTIPPLDLVATDG